MKRFRYLPATTVVLVFCATFIMTSSVAYATSGFLSVFARDNNVSITTDSQVGQLRLSISNKASSGFGEEIKSPISVDMKTSQNYYMNAGKLYIRNDSTSSGYVQPLSKFTSGGTYARDVTLKVTDENNKILYEGLLADYGSQNYITDSSGEIVMDNGIFLIESGETKTLNYYTKYTGNAWPAVDSSYRPVELREIKFDLEYQALQSPIPAGK